MHNEDNVYGKVDLDNRRGCITLKKKDKVLVDSPQNLISKMHVRRGRGTIEFNVHEGEARELVFMLNKFVEEATKRRELFSKIEQLI
jgi:hypothetical protein